jgi:YYY domain-containing protein
MTEKPSKTASHIWLFDFLLVIILLAGAYFRSVGLDWDEGQHLHPDERFLTMVESGIARAGTPEDQLGPAPTVENQTWRSGFEKAFKDCESWGGYFNTACSPLNPSNRGFTFFVYGTLPIFTVRYIAEWASSVSTMAANYIAQHGAEGIFGGFLSQIAGNPAWTGYDTINLVGRQLSALSDLITIILMYSIAARLYNRKVALLTAAFSTFAVLQIQLSHFFTVETYTNLCMFLAIYFAVRIATSGNRPGYDNPPTGAPRFKYYANRILRDSIFWNTIGFGLAYGMAMASKVNSFPLALLLPGAFTILYFRLRDDGRLTEEPPSEDEISPLASSLTEENPQPAVQPAVSVKRSSDSILTAIALFLILGGFFALLSFRILQPYAFRGEFGILDVRINPLWLQNIKEQRAQASGDVDYPPALQWADRSLLYSGWNMALWGLGIPVGILAFLGLGWMGWRILKGEWKAHVLLWGWTVLYFVWQSMQMNPTMRYQMPIYPLMAMMAAWFLVELAGMRRLTFRNINFGKVLAYGFGALALVASIAYSYAFIQIYIRPHTRVAAARWIYQNVPGPVNVKIKLADGNTFNQPIPFPYNYNLEPGSPMELGFTSQADGLIEQLELGYVLSPSTARGTALLMGILQDTNAPAIATATFTAPPPETTPVVAQTVTLDIPVPLSAGQPYTLNITSLESSTQADLCGDLVLNLQTPDGSTQTQTLQAPDVCTASISQPYQLNFTPQSDSLLLAIAFTKAVGIPPENSQQRLDLSVANQPGGAPESILAQGSMTGNFNDPDQKPGHVVTLDHPFEVKKGETYYIRLQSDGGPVTLLGAAPVNESSWDDGLPLRIDSFDAYGGIYQGDLNLELYWDDNAEKLARFYNSLDKGDYIFISSNRQWGTTTRVPERYPLTLKYYRELIGCPPERDVIWCYNTGKPGDFQGNLGFDLVAVFESFPQLGSYRIDDQFADEAFTVYDHPKVLIFKKSDSYDPQKVRALLGSVDLSKVVHITPGQAGKYPAGDMLPRVCGALPFVCRMFGANNLLPVIEKDYGKAELYATGGLLSIERRDADQAGGTWSDMFSYESLQNRFPALGVILWYLAFLILGIFTYPLLRFLLPGLKDKGYPLARMAGLLIWAWLSWLSASYGVPFTRVNVALTFVIILGVGGGLAYVQRDALRTEIREKGRYFLMIEGVFLTLFMIDLLIRLGNPDLWHPYKGGERPMDLSYLNAILKTTTFPPYDPWFAGGYINYYYYGYVLAAMPIKLLGIVPSIAYNMLLPTLFSLLGIGGFSLAWNLVSAQEKKEEESASRSAINRWPFLAGIAATVGLVLVGNLGVPRMIYLGFVKLGVPQSVIEQSAGKDPLQNSTVTDRLAWSTQGLGKVLSGTPLPYAWGDWYWNPSRIIPTSPGDVEPITEFPLFTFLYSDLHAHMIDLPVTLLALGWMLSLLLARGRWTNRWVMVASFAFGGLTLGAMRPINTWDFPVYLVLGMIATAYTFFRYSEVDPEHTPFKLPVVVVRGLYALAGMALLGAFFLLLYRPFTEWYAQGYNAISKWEGARTPISSYLSHWGLFLFVIISWMVWETRDWLASTPFSSLQKLKPFALLIEITVALLLAVMVYLQIFMSITIVWIALPLAFWAAVLILRPDIGDAKRAVLFMIGSGLFLTLLVEIIVLVGDLGRMNTVFKFYLQVWALFAVSAGASLGWLLPEMVKWHPRWRLAWEIIGTALLTGAALFLLISGFDKIRDRSAPNMPHAMDGMAYMAYSQYADNGQTMDLSQDYNAIRWMQANVKGSPVIVEANTVEYRWGSRFTIYTGLPGVVGWNWHQRQQRGFTPGTWVTDRVDEISQFYSTEDLAEAQKFLEKYNVRYIIVGLLERAYFTGPGLDKFPAQDGILWKKVYDNQLTQIYEVLP